MESTNNGVIMTDKPFDDSNWRSEYMQMRNLSKFESELLENGPCSLSQSWVIQALHSDWMKKKGYSYPEPPDCSSSLQEWEKKVKEIEDKPN